MTASWISHPYLNSKKNVILLIHDLEDTLNDAHIIFTPEIDKIPGGYGWGKKEENNGKGKDAFLQERRGKKIYRMPLVWAKGAIFTQGGARLL
ncbi:MAG: hypothetical protein JXA50_01255 [Deltaproteobacteria bacterium]|nr:hypothetical protein [Deltaproteobacteria bacterium]